MRLDAIPNKNYGHNERTPVPSPHLPVEVVALLNSKECMWMVDIYPDYFDNKWYIEATIGTAEGTVKIKDDALEFPSEEFITKLTMVTGK